VSGSLRHRRAIPGGRDTLVVTVWRTFNVGFIPEPGAQFDAACAGEIGQAAEQTAAHGATVAEAAGWPEASPQTSPPARNGRY
jgi:hypothetical protein